MMKPWQGEFPVDVPEFRAGVRVLNRTGDLGTITAPEMGHCAISASGLLAHVKWDDPAMNPMRDWPGTWHVISDLEVAEPGA